MPRLADPTPEALIEAAARLRAGALVAFPTETVYGLGADTFNPAALRAVFALKGRPSDNPLIAHVDGPESARRLVRGWDDRCERLAARFWPGPLTLVLAKAPAVPEEATAGLATIAVRAPAHDVAQRLLSTFGGPVSAPSANRSGHVSPTTARHVADDFAESADLLVLDGGPCAIGLESTVLDLTGDAPTILRPGGVTREALAAVVGPVEAPCVTRQAESPGTSPRHYAPSAAAELVDRASLARRLAAIGAPAVVLCFEADEVAAPHRRIVMPDDPDAYGRCLYDRLRAADALRPDRILIVIPPQSDPLWVVVHDRLRRATHPAGG